MTIAEHFLTIGFWTMVFWITVKYGRFFHKTYIFDPLAGGNGKIQMDEIAKGSIVLAFMYSVYMESTGKHQFSDQYWWSLMFGIFSIAGLPHLKHVFGKSDDKHKKEKIQTQTPTNEEGL